MVSAATRLFLWRHSFAGLSELCVSSWFLRCLSSATSGGFFLHYGDSVLNLAGHQGESLLDIIGDLSASLKEANTVVLGHFLALLGGHISLVDHVALVADKDAGNVVCRVLLDLSHPVVHVRVRLLLGDIIGDNDSVSSLVVGGGNGLEALLSGGVPNLELNLFAIDLDGLDFEVDANRRHEVIGEHVVRETHKERGLAHARRANEQHFEEVVAIGVIEG